jgi:hypothetical protein
MSVYSGYASSANPFIYGGFSPIQSGQPVLEGDGMYGGSISAGWQRMRERSAVAVRYSAGYTGLFRYTDGNGMNQNLTVSLNRQFGRLSLNASANGQYGNFTQLLYQPTSLSVISQAAPTLADLAAALSVGTFSNRDVAAMLTGAPAMESPTRALLLGDRILTYSGQAGFTYSYSPRLSFRFSSFTGGGQHIYRDDEPSQPNYAMPRSIGMDGGMGFTYALSPRTQIGVDVDEFFLSNQYQAGYGTNASFSLGRRMGQRWFLRGWAGGTYTTMTRYEGSAPRTRNLTGGGSIGFRTFAHTLAASYVRSGSDGFGFAVGTNSVMMGTWGWRMPGRSWGIFASISQQRMRDTGFADFSGWQASGGMTKWVTSQTTFSVQYVHAFSNGTFSGTPSKYQVDSVRVSFGWSPAESGR